MIRAIGAVALAAVALSGCATIIKGTSQNIAVQTPPATGANCVLTSKEGMWSVVTPGSVKIDKSKEDVLIHCTKPGYQDASGTIPSNFQGWTLGNIILGGVIGVGVDAASGAMNEYPNAYSLPMIAAEPAPSPIPSAPVVPAPAKSGSTS
jgi:hypothetical protein